MQMRSTYYCIALVAEVLVLFASAAQFRTPVSSEKLARDADALTNALLQFGQHQKQTPMERVVTLLAELETKVREDGKVEQQSYDKYACWCESTLARKATDISTAKTTIEEATTLIEKLKGQIATHGAEIADLNKAIEGNLASQKEAADAREAEKEEYTGEKTESEQCIGALEAAINVLNGAGTGKGFLEMKETQLLSVVAGVRGLLRQPLMSRMLSGQDMKMVKTFVERPQDFVGSGPEMSAVQIQNNPFGDYAPQSTQIQGILKSMYDAFAADLEKANAEESTEQKAFEALMATKRMELKTLKATLQHHEVDKAAKGKKEAETQQVRDDTQAQLDADEKFFAETKSACQSKAKEWSVRTRLRTEELQGMNKAIQILSSPEAKRTFVNATTTFLQVSSVRMPPPSDVPMLFPGRLSPSERRLRAFRRLQGVQKFGHNLDLAQIAANLQTGGHFDKVTEAIDKMMEILRKEEQDDIAHRDRCQVGTNKNSNDMEDLNHGIDVAEKSLTQLGGEKTDLLGEISALADEINATKSNMAELLELRNSDYAAFVQALKDDQDAIELLEQAIVSLTKFYKSNGIPLSFVSKQGPTYTIDEDKAPETTWKDDKYGGREPESGGIISLLGLIKEDLEMEIKTARSDDATAQAEYLDQRGAMKESLDKTTATKTSTETELADVEAKIQGTESDKAALGADLNGQEELKSSLYSDCSWVATHFETRRTKRKEEMAGLTDAKSYLAGVEAGDEV